MRRARRRVRGAGFLAILGAMAQLRCRGDDPAVNNVPGATDAATGGNPADAGAAPPPLPLGSIEQIVAGEAFTCVRGSGGAVRCWGSNTLGQLGQESPAPYRTDVSASSTVRFNTDEKVVELAAAYETVCALFERGSVRCWGGNGAGERGSSDVEPKGRAPGDTMSLAPVDVGPDRAATHLYAGTRHFCVITRNRGDVICWGHGRDNAGRFGWLGNGRADHVGDQTGEMGSSLTAVPLPEPTVTLALGFASTCALGESGAVRCFGVSRAGQLGNGSPPVDDPAFDVDDNVATAAPTLDGGAVALFGSGPSYAAKLKDAGVLTWGQNDEGRLGRGDTIDVTSPTSLPAPADILDVTSRSAHRCVILLGGDLYCFGGGDFGRLGYGDAARRGDTPATSLAAMTKPVLSKVRSVAVGGDHTCALREDATVVCWGKNHNGQLGYGDTMDRGAQPADRAEVLPPVRLE
jgi:E3 ubiquitin-protein ligase HERC3